jgi:CRP-like cAMP-binding protein
MTDDRTKIVTFISSSRLFGGLPAADIGQLASIAQLRRAVKKEIVFEDGASADRFYFVVDGKVKIFKRGPGGRDQLLRLILPGESFAEAAMFAGGKFPATAMAVPDTELLYFPRQAFLAILRQNPELTMRMLASLSRFCRQFLDILEDLSLRSVPARLAGYLLSRYHSAMPGPGEPFDLGISKGELASRLGIASETLSRTLKKFKNDGTIAIHRRSITILRFEKLKAFAAESAAEKMTDV